MENLNQKKDKLCNKCGRKCCGKNMFLESNGLCNFCNSIGTPCNNCKKNDKALHSNGLCDYCFFDDSEKFSLKHGSTDATATNIWGMTKIIFSIFFLVFLIWWIYIQVQGIKGQSECPYGYHLEEDFRQTISGCIPN